jgi:hypothetical protein
MYADLVMCCTTNTQFGVQPSALSIAAPTPLLADVHWRMPHALSDITAKPCIAMHA